MSGYLTLKSQYTGPWATEQAYKHMHNIDAQGADHKSCSIVEYTKAKFYEYVAMAEMLSILAGMRGKEAQKKHLRN